MNYEKIFNDTFEDFLEEEFKKDYCYNVMRYNKYSNNYYEVEISSYDEFVETNCSDDEGI